MQDEKKYDNKEEKNPKHNEQLWQGPVPLSQINTSKDLWQQLIRVAFLLSARAKEEFPPQFRLNILVSGPFGGGKSSFVNSVATIFRDSVKVIHTSAATSFAHTHGTKQVTHHLLENLAVNLIDTWGSSKSEIKNGNDKMVLEYLVSGHIEDKFCRGHKFEESQFCKLNKKRDPAFNVIKYTDKPHAAILMFPSTSPVTPEFVVPCVEILTKPQDLPGTILPSGIPHTLEVTTIFSKVDLLDQKLATKPEETYESLPIKEKVIELSRDIEIDSNTVYPCRLYHNVQNPNRNRYVEIMVMAPLVEAMQNALAFALREKQTLTELECKQKNY